MSRYPFLSDEWVAQARRIYAEVQSSGGPPSGTALAAVRVNLVVNEAPFSDNPIDAHIDTEGGTVAIGTGHLEQADVTVSLDYATARSLFVGGDVQAVMQAFLSGRLRVDGDLTKLLDPRTGIWAAGTPSAPYAAPSPAASSSAAPSSEGPPPAGPLPAGPSQPGFPFPGAHALQAAARLQEITE
jgi:hypothetical protein